MTEINLNRDQITNCLEYMNLNRQCFLISQNISADPKGPKVKARFIANSNSCTTTILLLSKIIEYNIVKKVTKGKE